MKIATVTYHRADNYGAVLQAYALYRYLKSIGHDAEVLDYWPSHHDAVYNSWTWNLASFRIIAKRNIPQYLIKILRLYIRRLKRKHNFNLFREKYIKIAKIKYKYDAVFYGSDTIWNKWNLNSKFEGFDPVYWGNEQVTATHKFAYAPSMGNVIDRDSTRSHCLTFLPNFTKISVRETNLKDKLNNWGWNDIVKVVDPTLLLSPYEWKAIGTKKIINEDYILCYNLECSQLIETIANSISKDRNIKVISLTASAKEKKNKLVMDLAGPVDFLSLFNYATYVLTSSFHGVLFSLIFEKQFIYNSAVETERISSILESCDISNRFVHSLEEMNKLEIIDYSIVNHRLNLMKKESYKFIDECLKIAEDAQRNM